MIGLAGAKVELIVDERANGGDTTATVLFFFSVSFVLTGTTTAAGVTSATGTGAAKTGADATITGTAVYLTGLGITAGGYNKS